ncbi:MAG: GTPase Era [Thermicanus sp.]|nr:GTPase Era [Thermicanus sp.]
MRSLYEGKKSGFVALIGRPNVGKSTLMNQMVGTKIAIMSDKPQTTRNRIRGILTREEGQIIFLDTPGIHKPRTKMGQYMMKVVDQSIREVDLLLLLIDAEAGIGRGDEEIMTRLKGTSIPIILVLNKIDKITPEALLPLIDHVRHFLSFAEIIPVSAINGNNVEHLIQTLYRYLPEGPYYFPPDRKTDQPETFLVAELIREKALNRLREEVPHSIAVEIEEYAEREHGTLYIRAVLYCERESQKGILIGKEGKMLKEIGQAARQDIESLFSTKVFLDLWVKVKEDWRNREGILRQLGFRED